MDFDPRKAAHAIAQRTATLGEVLAPVDEATKGYRDRLKSEGWSDRSAEAMAVEYYRTLMHLTRTGGGK